MNITFALNINSMRLRIPDARNGRRTFYMSLSFFGRRLWLMRWDCDRTSNYKTRFKSSDGVMGWTWGIHPPLPPI
jgi:hypothetical protein